MTNTYLAAKRARLEELLDEARILADELDNALLVDLLDAIEPICERHGVTISDVIDVLAGE